MAVNQPQRAVDLLPVALGVLLGPSLDVRRLDAVLAQFVLDAGPALSRAHARGAQRLAIPDVVDQPARRVRAQARPRPHRQAPAREPSAGASSQPSTGCGCTARTLARTPLGTDRRARSPPAPSDPLPARSRELQASCLRQQPTCERRRTRAFAVPALTRVRVRTVSPTCAMACRRCASSAWRSAASAWVRVPLSSPPMG